ncbi:MAG: PhoPQ-activated pathogenicity [Acidobacteria bacterium]|nr:MAG: PhoPQ-activated pathogenicity [Acidobacteriota bacterium]
MRRRLTLGLVPVFFFTVLCAQHRTALDQYVAAPDPNYRYELAEAIPGQGYTTYIISMVSQSWLTRAELTDPIWRHWLVVVKPDQVTSRTGLLFIGGGDNGKPAPKSADRMVVSIAQATQSVVAELRQVPNQPLTFVGDGRPRKEDDMIAYAWDKYLQTGDSKWAPRLPMTKSAVRAMDTITSFCAGLENNVAVDKFVVAGASKRGWTTWTTAIADRRVVAIAPLVIDLLNVVPSFEHHFQAYGFWAPAVHDYQEMGIMDKWLGSKEFDRLMELVDPYSYRDRLKMPKFLINASGDQFFLPDSWQFYWDDLKGIKYLRYVPNADHSLKNSDAVQSLLAFYQAVLTGAQMPEFSWKVEKDGTIRVKTKTTPTSVLLWQATNPKARDFRLDTIGPVWKSSVLQPVGKGEYCARVRAPAQGWTAYFLELTYPGSGQAPFKFTTGTRVSPQTLPFPSPLKKKKDREAEVLTGAAR